jgi:hypothetical protein
LVRFSGVTATIFATLLFTDFHDFMLLGFSLFTLITILTALTILYENKRYWCLASGVLSILLVQINNFMYYLRVRVDLLPAVQKLTIILVLIWVMSLNLHFHFSETEKK